MSLTPSMRPAAQRIGNADQWPAGSSARRPRPARRADIVVGDDERFALLREVAKALEQAVDRDRFADQVVDTRADQAAHGLDGGVLDGGDDDDEGVLAARLAADALHHVDEVVAEQIVVVQQKIDDFGVERLEQIVGAVAGHTWRMPRVPKESLIAEEIGIGLADDDPQTVVARLTHRLGRQHSSQSSFAMTNQ